jgi:hypothetical protein
MKNQLFYLTLTKVLLPLQTETKKFFFYVNQLRVMRQNKQQKENQDQSEQNRYN